MDKATLDCDLLIVGGGNAGAALALAGAKAGLSSLLLDGTPVARRAAPDFDGRAYALAAASVKALEALGVWRAVADKAQPMREIRISDGRLGDPGPVRLRFSGAELDRAPFAVLLEDRFLRGALLEAVAAEPLIEHRAPARVVDHRVEAARAVATLDDGSTVAARAIAACDGRRSSVAARAGIRWTGRRYGQTGLVCAVRHSIPHEGVARQVFYPGGPFAMLPLPGDMTSIVWSERDAEAKRIAALGDADYLAEIALRSGGVLGDLELAGGRWAYPLELLLAYSYVGPRVAAVGDAAHALHPIAGQGFNLALRDVAALAETLGEARRRGEDIGAPGPLAAYQRWRRADSTGLAMATDGLNRLFSTDSGLLRGVRDLGLAAVDAAPGLKRAFMTAAAGNEGDQPRMLRGLAP
jgi:2-octaprenyl-6-methoxyphenol hydroxylase